MGKTWLTGIGASLIIAVIVGGPVGYTYYRKHNFRNIRVVKDGVLYRSGQLSKVGLQRMIHDHGIRTVVTLRASEDLSLAQPDKDEEDFCRKLDIQHVRIPPRSWWPDAAGAAPAAKGVAAFLDVMDDAKNHPVLLHCFAGTHRTGAMVAIYRMEYERWTNSEALAELRGSGYTNLDKELDVLTYLENYRPRWRK